MKLIKTWRWFGEKDPVKLNWLKQMGIEGVVTALHHIPNGEIWKMEEIQKTREKIENAGLRWNVVESLPVTEAIKTGSLLRDKHIENYIISLQNLGKCGINTVVYNFMPVLDWARTNLDFKLPSGGGSMLFDYPVFVAFDVFILKRHGAEKDYPETLLESARKVFEKMKPKEAEELAHNIIVVTQGFIDGVIDPSIADYKKAFLEHIDRYKNIDREKLKSNLAFFLHAVIPEAEKAGVRLAIHPDDPPFPVLGMPRIFSTIDDMEWLSRACPSEYNGIAFCAGSFSARKDNNLVEMAEKFGHRFHFVHLRNTTVLDDGSFYESGHIEGGANMFGIVKTLYEEMKRRKVSGRDDFRIPMRPDHGIKLFDDFNLNGNPGYPLVGRLKGLAEISGIEEAVIQMNKLQ
jgi:mannonate dehydratase